MKNDYWGQEVAFDLYNCNATIIRSKKKIGEFIVQLCDLIHVKRFGMPQIVDFGEDARIAGISFTQLIETSLVSGHLANHTNTAYLNVFSCREFDIEEAEKFCIEFFEAKDHQKVINYRK